LSLAPPLFGLVLAGGSSRRMGRDKGLLAYAGEAQVARALRLLETLCEQAYVAVREAQAVSAPYAALPHVIDGGGLEGPAAGLVAAWGLHPGVAWLALAVDLPLVDRSVLEFLMGGRDPAAPATAFKHPDGAAEPLCTIFEPAARPLLLERIRAGDSSLRRLLEASAARLRDPPDPDRLQSIDTWADYERVRGRLEGAPVER
jgi:molybdopterin-guanine dinucleotide biosynthesis protein A